MTFERSARPSRVDRFGWVLFVAFLISSRLATAVYYVEDPDSLRFALATVDFSIPDLRPHFPGYPVFVALSKVAAFVTGGFSLGFALLGSLATLILTWALLRITRFQLSSPFGVVLASLVALNPMIWLMGTRYMPDLWGAALGWLCLAWLVEGRTRRSALLAGVLTGTRLSVSPLVVLPLAVAIVQAGWRQGGQATMFGVLGVSLWLVPTTLVTGLPELIQSAQVQTSGHFQEFGGTVQTEPHLTLRATRVVRSLWADGMGGFWEGRSPWTLLTSVFLVALPFAGFVRRRGATSRPSGVGSRKSEAVVGAPTVETRTGRDVPAQPRSSRHPRNSRLFVVGVGTLTYLIWIFGFQNVVHKARHVLPLLPLLIALVASGIWHRPAFAGHRPRVPSVTSLFAIGLILSSALITGQLVRQHQRPTALAQVLAELRQRDLVDTVIVGNSLVTNYLDRQGVEAEFLAVRDRSGLTELEKLTSGQKIMTVGDFRAALPNRDFEKATYFHNPYVNRLWSRIEVYSSLEPKDEHAPPESER